MKLILQECWFKWSLNQHHKNKRLSVQAASHTRLSRHFSHDISVFWQRKRRRPERSKTEEDSLVVEVDYNIWLCKPFNLHISLKDSILAEWPICLGWKVLWVSEQWTYLSPPWGRRSAALWFQEALPPDWKHPDLWTLAGAGEETKASIVNRKTSAQRKYDWRKVKQGAGPCYYKHSPQQWHPAGLCLGGEHRLFFLALLKWTLRLVYGGDEYSLFVLCFRCFFTLPSFF